MSQDRRGLVSRLFEGLGRVTWGVLRRKVNNRLHQRGQSGGGRRADSR